MRIMPTGFFRQQLQQAKELLEYGKGIIKMITVAPEVVSDEIIDLIHSYNIVVSAGHTMQHMKQATQSFNTIKTATHLYNAMSGLQHRAPGIVGAVLDHTQFFAALCPMVIM